MALIKENYFKRSMLLECMIYGTAGMVTTRELITMAAWHSFDAFNDRKAAHLMSAFAHDDQIILAHLAIDEKSNEIPAVQDLVTTLGLSGRLFTVDAMHAQKNIRGGAGDGQSPGRPAQEEPADPV